MCRRTKNDLRSRSIRLWYVSFLSSIRLLKQDPDCSLGEEGSPPNIPPNTDLMFDVELLEIERDEHMEGIYYQAPPQQVEEQQEVHEEGTTRDEGEL